MHEKVDERAAVAKYNVTPTDTKVGRLAKHLRWSKSKSVHELLPESSKVVTGQTCMLQLSPLEALKAIIPIAASHSPEFSLIHVDGSRSYFHVKAQRPLLVTLQAEDCSGKDKGKIGLLKKSMYGTRDAASDWERDWQGHLANSGYELVRKSRNLFHNKKGKTLGLTHGDDFVVTGTKERLLELKKQLESVYHIKASIIGAKTWTTVKHRVIECEISEFGWRSSQKILKIQKCQH